MKRPGSECPDVVITAGGTKEKIDDVRYVSNFATGELGHTLAETYAGLGYHVLLLAAGAVTDRFGRLSGVEHCEFTSAADLQSKLLGINAASLVFQSAAISDYTPVAIEGKISSDQDELVIRMRRAPKILPQLRQHFGPDTTLVGFKLLSGASETTLLSIAQAQIEQCGTDYCIANDLSNIGVRRQIHIVEPDGTYQSFNASVPDLAIDIAKAIPLP